MRDRVRTTEVQDGFLRFVSKPFPTPLFGEMTFVAANTSAASSDKSKSIESVYWSHGSCDSW